MVQRIDQFVKANEHHLAKSVRILVVGAGGLGCEIIKCLCMSSFEDIHIIDMDLIELTNLNRQFLFKDEDIGKPKAIVAAESIRKRFKNSRITAYYAKIQDKDMNFYSQFSLIVCGLDSLTARRWMNSMIHSLLIFSDDDDGNKLDMTSVVPLIDGGSEGFTGSVLTVIPGVTACLECNLNLFKTNTNESSTYPMCTLANTPRIPAHCIEYCRIVQWPNENPFNTHEPPDLDNDLHIQWLHNQSLSRARHYCIDQFSLAYTLGVLKNIVPAVSTTNAMIASLCVLEVLNICAGLRKNETNFSFLNATNNDISLVSFKTEKNDSCLVCGTNSTLSVPFDLRKYLSQFVDYLKEDPSLQMENPSIAMQGDQYKSLYIPHLKSLREATENNLNLSLLDLGITDKCVLSVADVTHRNPVLLTIIDSSHCADEYSEL
ncbi:hypothetical protein GJ496_005628 [Pomphorhynchus laevis]|nr:hypothetical protein GJ496_005628 [Pomphorhynchus laevis]